MAETCRLTRGKEFTACRLHDGSVFLRGQGEIHNTCQHLGIRPAPVYPDQKPKGQYNLLACQEADGKKCGQIDGFLVIHERIPFPKELNVVTLNTSDGAIDVPISIPRDTLLDSIKEGESIGVSPSSFDEATLNAIEHLPVKPPTNPDVAITAVVTELGYVYRGFVNDHFYVKVRQA